MWESICDALNIPVTRIFGSKFLECPHFSISGILVWSTPFPPPPFPVELTGRRLVHFLLNWLEDDCKISCWIGWKATVTLPTACNTHCNVILYDSISDVKSEWLFDLCLDTLIGLFTSPSPPLSPSSLSQVKMKPNTAEADWSGHLPYPSQNILV